MKTGKKIMLLGSLIVFFSSCVSLKEFNETKDKLTTENEQLKQSKMELEAANAELTSRVEQLNARNKELQEQLEETLYDLNLRKQSNTALQKDVEDLQKQLDVLHSGSSAEIEKLMAELQQTQGDLNAREDKLREAERELEERNAKLIELQNVLAQKDQAVQDLKKKVMDALVGFNNQGLTVHEKTGRCMFRWRKSCCLKPGSGMLTPKDSRR
jgi:chemotaxis protein MotB